MCNGHSTRSSQGGTIAILKPTSTPGRPSMKRESSFRLAEDSATGTTIATFDALDLNGADGQVIIHRDGDLRSTSIEPSTALHRIDIPSKLPQGMPFQLPSRLDLGVGATGIIGRRVSLLVDQTLVGIGVVGYN